MDDYEQHDGQQGANNDREILTDYQNEEGGQNEVDPVEDSGISIEAPETDGQQGPEAKGLERSVEEIVAMTDGSEQLGALIELGLPERRLAIRAIAEKAADSCSWGSRSPERVGRIMRDIERSLASKRESLEARSDGESLYKDARHIFEQASSNQTLAEEQTVNTIEDFRLTLISNRPDNTDPLERSTQLTAEAPNGQRMRVTVRKTSSGETVVTINSARPGEVLKNITSVIEVDEHGNAVLCPEKTTAQYPDLRGMPYDGNLGSRQKTGPIDVPGIAKKNAQEALATFSRLIGAIS